MSTLDTANDILARWAINGFIDKLAKEIPIMWAPLSGAFDTEGIVARARELVPPTTNHEVDHAFALLFANADNPHWKRDAEIERNRR